MVGNDRSSIRAETPASGIGNNKFFRACWYRRTVDVAPTPPDHRRLLHFGAVDYGATVWINGYEAGRMKAATPRSRSICGPSHNSPAFQSSCVPKTIPATLRNRAANRIGSSNRTRSGIRARPASGRRCGSKWFHRRGSSAFGGRRISNDGRSDWKRGSAGCAARPEARRQASRRATHFSPMTPMPWSPVRSIGGSHCPIPVSTTTEMGCCGIRRRRR